MPIVSKAVFSLPLINVVSTKSMNTPEALAKAFTDQYVRALQAGLPGGTPSMLPPTLPAPGLNPTTPPPYPIARVPVNNYYSRQLRMQKVMKAYFLARQIIVQNGNITSVIRNIKTIIKLVPQIRKDIQDTVKQVQALKSEVQKLPQLIEDLKFAAEFLVKEELEQIGRLIDGLNDFKIEVDLEQFELLQTLKSFKEQKLDFKSIISQIDKIATIADQLEKFIENIPVSNQLSVQEAEARGLIAPPTIDPSFDEAAFLAQSPQTVVIETVVVEAEDPTKKELANVRRYFIRQILESFKNVFYLANAVTSPMEYIGYYRSLASFDSRYARILNILEKYRLVWVFIKPLLQKLRMKAEKKITELKVLIQDKIAVLKENLKKKLEEKVTQRTSPEKLEIRKARLKQIKERKKKSLNTIRLIKYISSDVSAILKLVNRVNENRKLIEKDVKYQLKTGIKDFLEGVTSVDPETDLNLQLTNNGFGVNFEDKEGNVSEFITPITDKEFVKVINTSPMPVFRTDQEIHDFLNTIKIPVNKTIRQLIVKAIDSIRPIKLLTPYPLYRYFLAESQQYVALYNNVTELRRDIKEIIVRTKILQKNIKPLVKAEDYVRFDKLSPYEKSQLLGIKQLVNARGVKKSIREVLRLLYDGIELELNKIKKELKEIYDTYKPQVEQEIQNIKQTVEKMLLSLVPIKHEIKDKMTKAELLAYKKKRIKDRVLQTVRLVKGLQLIFKAFSAFKKFLITNIFVKKIYGYRENAKAINDMIDSFFDFLIFQSGYTGGKFWGDPQELQRESNQPNGKLPKDKTEARAKELIKQKETLKLDIRVLLSYLELGVELIIDVGKELKESASRGETPIWDRFKTTIEQKYKNSPTLQDYLGIATFIEVFFKSLQEVKNFEGKHVYTIYQNVVDFKQSANNLNNTRKLLKSTAVRTALIRLENELLGNIKARYSQFADSELAQTAEAVQLDANVSSKRSAYYRKLSRIVPPSLKKLKEESLLLVLIDLIAECVRYADQFITNMYKKYIHPEIIKLKDEFAKYQDNINAELEAYTKRLANYDVAFALPKALNLATKLFWQNFTWLAPDGTRFQCKFIPQITPLRDPITKKLIVPDDGLAGWIEAASWALFDFQLPLMVGTVTPPPNTGIPTLIFKGYK